MLAKLDTDANPSISPGLRHPGHPRRQGVQGRRGRRASSSAPSRRPPVERFFDALVPTRGRRAGRGRRRGVAAPGARARARPRRRRVALARDAPRPRRDRRGARAASTDVTGNFQADGLAARIRLESDRRRPGVRQRVRRARRRRPRGARLDALSTRSPPSQRPPARTCAAPSSACSTSSASSTRSRASTAAGWRQRSTDARARRRTLAACAHERAPTRSGRSHQKTWPTSSRISSRAPGMRRGDRVRRWRPAASGPRSPWMTSVGALDLAPAVRSCRGRRSPAPGASGRRAGPAAGWPSRGTPRSAPRRAAKAGETLTSQPVRSASSRSPDMQRLAQPLDDRRVGQRGVRRRRRRCSRASACATRSGCAQRELLGDHPAHRDAHHVGALDAQRVEQRRRRRRQVGDRERAAGAVGAARCPRWS